MAFPTIASAAGQAFVDIDVTHSVNMPATVNAGDLLLLFTASRNPSAITLTTPPGWTLLFSDDNQWGNRIRSTLFYKIASGSEGGTAVSVASNQSTDMYAITHRITNWHGTTPPEAARATGLGTAPDAPSLTPSWGAADTLWFSYYSQQYDANGTQTPPANYTLGPAGSTVSGDPVSAGSATRTLNAASEDSGAWTTARNEVWGAALVAVRPATGPAKAVLFAHYHRLRRS